MIGIFDSGIGGLTVAREVQRHLPDESFLYLGDTARAPYGNKSYETIRRYAAEDMRWLEKKGASLFVVACNTMSTLGTGFFSLQSAQPVFDVIGPAVEEALRVTRNGKIGVIGTRATVLSGVYEQQLKEKTGIEVYSAACPLFVSLVEEGWLDRPETESIARHYLKPLLEKNIDTLILGCTHYPLLAPVIQKIVGDAAVLVDSAVSTAARVKKYLVEQQPDMPKNKPAHRFCLTDFAPHYDMIASSWLNIPVAFERIELSEAIRLV